MQVKEKYRSRTHGKIIKNNAFKIINPCHFEEKYGGLLEFVEKLLIYERNIENRDCLKQNLDILRGLHDFKKKPVQQIQHSNKIDI